jgi:hypothetical protein
MTLRAVALAACALGLAGCNIQVDHDRHVGTPHREHKEIPLARAAKAEFVSAEFRIGAGEIHLSGGAKELFEGDFSYGIDAWKPDVSFEGGGFRGHLVVRQGKSDAIPLGETENKWELRLANAPALDLTVNCGAGENRLDLSELNLRHVDVHVGVGEVHVDLRNHPIRDYTVNISGGVGQVEVLVPADVGVEAKASGGIGEINMQGFHKQDGRWVNDSFGKTKATIHLSVSGGVGEIKVRSE